MVLHYGSPSHSCKMGLKAAINHDKMERYVARIQKILILNQPFPIATATHISQKQQHQTNSWARQGPQTTRSLLPTHPEHVQPTQLLRLATLSSHS